MTATPEHDPLEPVRSFLGITHRTVLDQLVLLGLEEAVTPEVSHVALIGAVREDIERNVAAVNSYLHTLTRTLGRQVCAQVGNDVVPVHCLAYYAPQAAPKAPPTEMSEEEPATGYVVVTSLGACELAEAELFLGNPTPRMRAPRAPGDTFPEASTNVSGA